MLVWGLAAVFGISALLVASETAYTVLRIAGAVYLVFLGVRMLFCHRAPGGEPSAAAGLQAGFLVNVTNPKAGVFAISFLPQFVPADAAGPLPLLTLVLVWMLVDTVWYTALALALTRVGRWLRTATARRRLERTSGGAFVAFGIAMAVEG